jgi:signal transduction histidine kinase
LLEIFTPGQIEKEQIYPKLIRTTKELDNVVKDLNTILELKKNSDTYITIINLETEMASVLKNMEREIIFSHAKISTDFKQADKLNTVKPYLDSILYNLISNAIKYRHPNRDPVISIKTERTQSEICLSVADNGLGIDLAKHREKLFNLYSRFHLHIEGKGMGLYLVKTQMTTLGGRLEVESEVDRGTIFKAYFRS